MDRLTIIGIVVMTIACVAGYGYVKFTPWLHIGSIADYFKTHEVEGGEAMGALTEYRDYSTPIGYPRTAVIMKQLADEAIKEKEAEVKAVIAIAKHNLPPENIHSFLDDLRATLGRGFVELYNT